MKDDPHRITILLKCNDALHGQCSLLKFKSVFSETIQGQCKAKTKRLESPNIKHCSGATVNALVTLTIINVSDIKLSLSLSRVGLHARFLNT